MSASNFANRLLKELKRGGKKTIVLAALLMVGVVIWAPMLWRSLFGQPQSAAPAASSGKSSTKKESASPVIEGSVKPIAVVTDWKTLYRRLEKSSLVQPVVLDELVRDPFDQDWIREVKKPVGKPDSDKPAENDPIRTLALTATLAGGNESAAVIGEGVYRVGEEVPKKGPIRYVLKEIRQDRVLLERAGNIVELRMKDSGSVIEELPEQVP